MSPRRFDPWGRAAASAEPETRNAPTLLFRSRLTMGRARAASIAAVSVAAGSAFAWFVSGPVASIAVVAAAAAAIGVGRFVWRGRRLVSRLARDGDDLLIETLFAPASASLLRARLAETEGWRSYVETLGHLGLKTHNRLVVFRHRGVAYAVPVDHGETIDRAALDALAAGGDERL